MLDRHQMKQLRIKNGYSQNDIAEKTGLSRNTIAKIELGLEKNPKINTIKKIEAALL